MEAALAVTVGVDDLLRAVCLGHVRKAAALLQDVGGRVVEEHDEAGITVVFCRFKGCAQAFQLPLHQLLCAFRFFLVPAGDLPTAIQIEGAFEGPRWRINSWL